MSPLQGEQTCMEDNRETGDTKKQREWGQLGEGLMHMILLQVRHDLVGAEGAAQGADCCSVETWSVEGGGRSEIQEGEGVYVYIQLIHFTVQQKVT